MDVEQPNPPGLLRLASWLLLFEVRGESHSTFLKRGGHLNHLKPARVANMRELYPFTRSKAPLLVKIWYDQCKLRIELVGEYQVKQLQAHFKLVTATPYLYKPGFGHALYPRDLALVSACHVLLAIWRRFNSRFAPVRVESVHCFDEPFDNTVTCMPIKHGDG